jgi:hypothetical protein
MSNSCSSSRGHLTPSDSGFFNPIISPSFALSWLTFQPCDFSPSAPWRSPTSAHSSDECCRSIRSDAVPGLPLARCSFTHHLFCPMASAFQYRGHNAKLRLSRSAVRVR